MAVTISTHNGSAVSFAHNRREKWMVQQENKKWAEKYPSETRIDPTREHETWYEEKINEAYHKLFDTAVNEWNQKQLKQGKRDRVISDYLKEIRAKENKSKNSKHAVYEMIFSIGNKDNTIQENMAKSILWQHVDGFTTRNPNLHVIGVYYHADEAGVPHVHLDYIPVARGCTRGMSVQNSLAQALKEQGIYGESQTVTGQILWERQENDALEKLCTDYGLTVEHPERGTKVEHMSDEVYKLQKELKATQEELEKTKKLPLGKTIIAQGRKEQLESIEKKYIEGKKDIDIAKAERLKAKEVFEAYNKAYKSLQNDKTRFEEKVNEAANRKVTAIKDNAVEFIKTMGLWDKFTLWIHSIAERAQIKLKP